MQNQKVLMLHGPLRSKGRDFFTHREFFAGKIARAAVEVDFDCERNIFWLIREFERLNYKVVYVGWTDDGERLSQIFDSENLLLVDSVESGIPGAFGFLDNTRQFHRAVSAGLTWIKDNHPGSTVLRLRSDTYLNADCINRDVEMFLAGNSASSLMLQEFVRTDMKCILDFFMVGAVETLHRLHCDLHSRKQTGMNYSDNAHYNFAGAILNPENQLETLYTVSRATINSMLWRGAPSSLRGADAENFICDAVLNLRGVTPTDRGTLS